MILSEWFSPEIPSQFSNRNFLDFLWEVGLIKPLREELGFRILTLFPFLFFMTFRYLNREEGLFNQLKAEMKYALTLTRQGVRFPYKLHFPEDCDLVIFLVVTSIAFGLYHIPGYGCYKFVPTFVMGILLAWLFLRYGGLACIAYHIIHNSILITAEYYFLDYAFLVKFGVIPSLLFGFVFFFEYIFPIKDDGGSEMFRIRN